MVYIAQFDLFQGELEDNKHYKSLEEKEADLKGTYDDFDFNYGSYEAGIVCRILDLAVEFGFKKEDVNYWKRVNKVLVNVLNGRDSGDPEIERDFKTKYTSIDEPTELERLIIGFRILALYGTELRPTDARIAEVIGITQKELIVFIEHANAKTISYPSVKKKGLPEVSYTKFTYDQGEGKLFSPKVIFVLQIIARRRNPQVIRHISKVETIANLEDVSFGMKRKKGGFLVDVLLNNKEYSTEEYKAKFGF